MEYTGTCRICGDKITFKENPYVLGIHLLKKHPELEILHFALEFDSSQLPKKKCRSLSKLSLLKKTSSLFKRNNRKSTKKNNLYKTTVETWKPGGVQLTCPVCGCNDKPYIRRQRNKVAYNSLGAFFLMGCWPLCFMPMVMCGTSETLVCCKCCGHCFGTYDRRTGKLTPLPQAKQVDTPNVC